MSEDRDGADVIDFSGGDEDRPIAPNQLLLQLQEIEREEGMEVLAVTWRGPDGRWRCAWSDVDDPSQLLEAKTALSLDCEVAWATTQEDDEDE